MRKNEVFPRGFSIFSGLFLWATCIGGQVISPCTAHASPPAMSGDWDDADDMENDLYNQCVRARKACIIAAAQEPSQSRQNRRKQDCFKKFVSCLGEIPNVEPVEEPIENVDPAPVPGAQCEYVTDNPGAIGVGVVAVWYCCYKLGKIACTTIGGGIFGGPPGAAAGFVGGLVIP